MGLKLNSMQTSKCKTEIFIWGLLYILKDLYLYRAGFDIYTALLQAQRGLWPDFSLLQLSKAAWLPPHLQSVIGQCKTNECCPFISHWKCSFAMNHRKLLPIQIQVLMLFLFKLLILFYIYPEFSSKDPFILVNI